MWAQQTISLPQPDKTVSTTLFTALQNRHSDRDFATTPVSDAVLSQVLWAATGVNRPDGKLTVPSANNVKDINVYVCRQDGAYKYIPASHSLVKVTDKDLRKIITNTQPAIADAPVLLVLTSDMSKIRSRSELVSHIDAGYVSQNICLVCAALNLGTVPRMQMDKNTLKSELKLKDDEILILNHPVGYVK